MAIVNTYSTGTLKVNLGSTISGNGIITLVRGDTFKITIDLNIGTPLEPIYYTLTENDCVVFRIFEANSVWESYMFSKEATIDDLDENGNVTFLLSSDDSEYLKPGRYYYQIRLFCVNGDNAEVITLMPRTKFNIVD